MNASISLEIGQSEHKLRALYSYQNSWKKREAVYNCSLCKLNAHNFSSIGLIKWFSESLERGLSDYVLKIWIPWAIATIFFRTSIPSERAPSKLSEKLLNLDHQNSSYRANSSAFKITQPSVNNFSSFGPIMLWKQTPSITLVPTLVTWVSLFEGSRRSILLSTTIMCSHVMSPITRHCTNRGHHMQSVVVSS